MGQLDRDWYKDHYKKRSPRRTLDNDPRETDDYRPPITISIWHLVTALMVVITVIVWLFL